MNDFATSCLLLAISFFLSHPVIPVCMPLFRRKQQEQYPLLFWQLLIQTLRCLLCTWSTASVRKKRLFEFHPLGQSIILASPVSEHNIPTEKVISCSDLALAPFIKGPQGQKHNVGKDTSSPSVTWQSQQKMREEALGRQIHRKYLISLRLFLLRDSAWTETQSPYHPTQGPVCDM